LERTRSTGEVLRSISGPWDVCTFASCPFRIDPRGMPLEDGGPEMWLRRFWRRWQRPLDSSYPLLFVRPEAPSAPEAPDPPQEEPRRDETKPKGHTNSSEITQVSCDCATDVATSIESDTRSDERHLRDKSPPVDSLSASRLMSSAELTQRAGRALRAVTRRARELQSRRMSARR
jgi:hypothetical protein